MKGTGTKQTDGRHGQDCLLTPRDVAGLLSVGQGVAKRLIENGHIRALMVGSRWRVRPVDLETYIARQLDTSGQPDPDDWHRPTAAGRESRRVAQRQRLQASKRAAREAEVRRAMAASGGSNLLNLLSGTGVSA